MMSFHTVLTLLTVLIVSIIRDASTLMEFRPERLCFMEDRLRYGYTKTLGHFEDKKTLTCARACMDDDTCDGFSFAVSLKNNDVPNDSNDYSNINTVDNNNNTISATSTTISFAVVDECYLHQDYLTNAECRSLDDGDVDANPDVLYRKFGVCYNGGVWQEEARRCNCAPSGTKVGRLCTATPRHCRDLVDAGYGPPFKKITLKPLPYLNAPLLSGIICWFEETTGKSRMRIGRNMLVEDEFRRTWAEFETGFVKPQSIYWMGLKYVHEIIRNTVESTTLLVEVLKRLNVVHGYIEYYNVKIGNATDGYRLRYSGHKLYMAFADSPASFCFQESNGEKFSTFDADNDKNPTENCADLNGNGGWFGTNCETPCNLFGNKYMFDQKIYGTTPPYSMRQVRVPMMNLLDLAMKFNKVHLALIV